MYNLPDFEGLKNYRKKRGMTQAELARRAGVSQSLIARIEAGDIDPRLSTVGKILGALKSGKSGDAVTVGDVMRTPVVHVKISDTVADALKLMEKHGISQLPVLENGIQKGSVSERGIVKKMALEKDVTKLSARSVREIKAPGFPTVDRETDIKSISNLVENNPAVLVVDGGRAVGIITKADVLKLMKI